MAPSRGNPDDDDEGTLDVPAAPVRVPKPPTLPTPTTGIAAQLPPVSARRGAGESTTPIKRASQPLALDDDDGNFEGDDPPTTAEPIRDHHPQIVPRSPNIATRPVPKWSGGSDAFDDDANPTMFDPHVPTGGEPRAYDPDPPKLPPYEPLAHDARRQTQDLSAKAKRAMEPTADLGPAARRAFLEQAQQEVADAARGPAPLAREPEPLPEWNAPRALDVMPPVGGRDYEPTADLGRHDLGTPAHGTTAEPPLAAGSSPRASTRPGDVARTPPGPTGPMLRPPPSAEPPARARPASSVPPTPGSGARPMPASGVRAKPASAPPPLPRPLVPSAPPPFVADRRALQAPVVPVAAPAAPVARIDDSSRTQRWDGRPVDPYAQPHSQAPIPPAYPQAPPGYVQPLPAAPMQAISHKTPNAPEVPRMERPLPQVQLRSMGEVAKTPPHGMGHLAPPRDPNKARTRRVQDLVIWGSVIVITASIVTLLIWLIAR